MVGQVAVPLTSGTSTPDAPRARPPFWAVLSSAAAPVVLVGGWLIAGAVQPAGYDPVRQTISALAAHGAHHRWVMTLGLAGLGLAHLTTAAGLRGIRPPARLVLAAAGLATLGVAAFSEPAHGSSGVHAGFATTAFVLLALWPAMMRGDDPSLPWAQRAPVALAATAVSLGLLLWFAVTLSHGPIGVSERLLSAQQALWPLVVVATARRSARGARLGA